MVTFLRSLTATQENTYFLYSIGSRAMTGEDLLSTGCCGVWGYLVSRRGCQKVEVLIVVSMFFSIIPIYPQYIPYTTILPL